eukprot:1638537-Pyramimonas_sp.AAC.2
MYGRPCGGGGSIPLDRIRIQVDGIHQAAFARHGTQLAEHRRCHLRGGQPSLSEIDSQSLEATRRSAGVRTNGARTSRNVTPRIAREIKRSGGPGTFPETRGPGIFHARVRPVGRGPEYSPHESAPLAEAWAP